MGYKVVIGKSEDDNAKEENKDQDTVEVFMNVYFDGTNNNQFNIDEYHAHERKFFIEKKHVCNPTNKFTEEADGSHVQGYSNVAYLHKISQDSEESGVYYRSVYVEGIGTEERDEYKDVQCNFYSDKIDYEDSTISAAMGIALQGVKSKVKRGCEKVEKVLRKIIEKEKKSNPLSVKLHLVVVGFSRGAAAARCFAGNLFNSAKIDLGLSLSIRLEPFYTITQFFKKDDGIVAIDVSLLGTFDTVSSTGFFDSLTTTASAFVTDKYSASNVMYLNLDHKKHTWIKNTFQLCAADEYRMHFSLTRMNGQNCQEYILPGCHSDIGGGYKPRMQEVFERDKPLSTEYKKRLIPNSDPFMYNQSPYLIVYEGIDYERSKYNGEKTIQELENEGWFYSEELKGNYAIRTIYSNYSKIPFLYMKNRIDKTEHKQIFVDDIAKRYYLTSDDLNSITYQSKGKKVDITDMEKDKVQRTESYTLKGTLYAESHVESPQRTRVDLKTIYNRFNPEGGDLSNIYYFGKKNRICLKETDKSTSNILRQLHHDYLHISAKSWYPISKAGVGKAAVGNRRIVCDPGGRSQQTNDNNQSEVSNNKPSEIQSSDASVNPNSQVSKNSGIQQSGGTPQTNTKVNESLSLRREGDVHDKNDVKQNGMNNPNVDVTQAKTSNRESSTLFGGGHFGGGGAGSTF